MSKPHAAFDPHNLNRGTGYPRRQTPPPAPPVPEALPSLTQPFCEGKISYNVYLDRRRTSLRLEPTFWAALQAVAAHEERSLHNMIAHINMCRNPDEACLTSAVRSYILVYLRRLAKL